MLSLLKHVPSFLVGVNPSSWYKRLGHISKNRIGRLVSNEILDTKFDACVEYIKDKQTMTSRLGAYRSYKHYRIDTYRHLQAIPYTFMEWSIIFYIIHRQFLKICILRPKKINYNKEKHMENKLMARLSLLIYLIILLNYEI